MKSLFSGKNVDIIFFSSLLFLSSIWLFKKFNIFSTSKNKSLESENHSKQNNDSIEFNNDAFIVNIIIIYSSQTGTALKFSKRLSKLLNYENISLRIVNLCDLDEPKLLEIIKIKNNLALFILSTYGEGEPPSSGRKFYENIMISKTDLTGLNCSTFGLGNSIYPKFNTFAKTIDKKLRNLGARMCVNLALGDVNYDLEGDFLRWSSSLKEFLISNYNLSPMSDTKKFDTIYHVEIVPEASVDKIFTGEQGRYKSFIDQRPPFDERNPYMAVLIKKKNLTNSSERTCLHLEFDIFGSRLKYEPGDYVGLFCLNDKKRIEILESLFENVNFDLIIQMKPKEIGIPDYFPNPCSIRTAFLHYLEIQHINDPTLFAFMAYYTQDPIQKSYLERLSSDTLEGMSLRKEFIDEDGRDIVEVLQEFTSCHIPVEVLVQVLPRLSYRHYSISSRPDNNPLPSTLHVTASVVDYKNKLDRTVKGICTGWLDRLRPGSQVPLFITRSQFHLPHDPKVPLILVGPGTGIAPLRSFLQKRDELQREGHVLGLCLLFFGCRYSATEYLYQSELEDYLEKGVITNLYTAFSRDPPIDEKDFDLISMTSSKKIYVQHRMAQASAVIWQVLISKGIIFISGDKNMAKDVNRTLLHIIADRGNKSIEEANKYLEKLKSSGRYNIDVWS